MPSFTKHSLNLDSLKTILLIECAEETDLHPPAGKFNYYLEKELARGGKNCSATFGRVLYNYRACTNQGFNENVLVDQVIHKELSGLLEATCLIHTRVYGMALYQMTINLVELTSLPLRQLMEKLSFTSTAKGINAILDFRIYLITHENTDLILWSRLISESFHRNLQPDYDKTLAFTLATLISHLSPLQREREYFNLCGSLNVS